MRTLAIGLLSAAFCFASIALPSGFAWGQSAPAHASEINPIGKVMSAAGTVTVEHSAPVLVQANAPAGGGVKVGDLLYQGDVIQTGADGSLALTFVDNTSFNISANARM